jgi:hypothetical protein
MPVRISLALLLGLISEILSSWKSLVARTVVEMETVVGLVNSRPVETIIF